MPTPELTERLLEDLLDPDRTPIQICREHDLTLAQLDDLTRAQPYRDALARIDRINDARQVPIDAQSERTAHAALRDTIHLARAAAQHAEKTASKTPQDPPKPSAKPPPNSPPSPRPNPHPAYNSDPSRTATPRAPIRGRGSMPHRIRHRTPPPNLLDPDRTPIQICREHDRRSSHDSRAPEPSPLTPSPASTASTTPDKSPSTPSPSAPQRRPPRIIHLARAAIRASASETPQVPPLRKVATKLDALTTKPNPKPTAKPSPRRVDRSNVPPRRARASQPSQTPTTPAPPTTTRPWVCLRFGPFTTSRRNDIMTCARRDGAALQTTTRSCS